jgi:hypothetical protein
MRNIFAKTHDSKQPQLPKAGQLARSSSCGVEGFLVRLYVEHLEEASFLYAQRRVLLNDPELGWADLHDFEARFEAHIDALVIGDELAIAVCRQQAFEGDFGELHAAVKVCCRQRRLDVLEHILHDLDLDQPDRVAAVADALRDELPHDWQDALLAALGSASRSTLLAAAKLVQLNRIELGSRSPSGDGPVLEWVAGKLRDYEAVDTQMSELLHHGEPDVRTFHAFAMLSQGDASALAASRCSLEEEAWALLPVMVAGNQADVDSLHARLQRAPHPDAMLALGLVGDVRAVGALTRALNQKEHAEHAALALHLLTGAPLVEDATANEPIDEDELFPAELELHRRGGFQRPRRVVRRLCRDAQKWQAWWNDNQHQFDPQLRYRCGAPCSPAVLFELLRGSTTPHRIRQLAYEELVIRYNLDIPFDAELFVDRQLVLLEQISEWVIANEPRFEPGKWYFAGEVV